MEDIITLHPQGKVSPRNVCLIGIQALTVPRDRKRFCIFLSFHCIGINFQHFFTRIKNIEKLNTGRVPAQVVWVYSTGWKNVLSGHPVREPQVNLRVYVFLRVGRNLPNCRRCTSEKSSAVLTCSYAPDVSFLSHSKLCLLERTLWNSIALWRRVSV
jgi:hypothetical protein